MKLELSRHNANPLCTSVKLESPALITPSLIRNLRLREIKRARKVKLVSNQLILIHWTSCHELEKIMWPCLAQRFIDALGPLEVIYHQIPRSGHNQDVQAIALRAMGVI